MSKVIGTIVVTLLVVAAGSSAQPVHNINPAVCKDGVVHAPRGPFAVWVFCEDALATHLGVVYASHMANPVDGAWGISDRFWQAGEWASDALTFAWSADGERLFVSTGAVYGSSSLYQLELRQRKARRLAQSYPGLGVEIIAVSAARIRFLLRSAAGDAVERQVGIQQQ